MSEQLLPCPFCGGEAKTDSRYIGYGSVGLGSHDEYYIKCVECRAASDEFRDIKQAIAAWNRRAKPNVRALTGWISVDDESPTYMDHVIVRCESNHMAIDFMLSDGTWGYHFNSSDFITHWQPLPAPPTYDQQPREGARG